MNNAQLIVVLFVVFFGLAFARVPITVSLALAGVGTAALAGIPPTVTVRRMYESLDSFTLLAIPFFLLVGKVMNSGGVTDRLTRFVQTLVGHITGGMAHINVVVSMLFAGISGSATADTAGVGSVMIPAMKRAGFPPGFSVAVTAASSTLGAIIPPSVIMIIYGAVGRVSIGALFLGGAVPGLLVGLGQMGYSYVLARRNGWASLERASPREAASAFMSASAAIVIPVLVIGGIIGGYFTATEAGMVAAVYALVLTVLVYRTQPIRGVPRLFSDSVMMYAVVLFAIGTAGVFGWLLAYLGAPTAMANLVEENVESPVAVLGLMVVLFIVVGHFLDAIPAIVIFLPVVTAVTSAADLHPVHVGVVITFTLCLGLITPPYGMTFLLASAIGDVRFKPAVRALLPFYGIFLILLVFLIMYPELTLFLPRIMVPEFL